MTERVRAGYARGVIPTTGMQLAGMRFSSLGPGGAGLKEADFRRVIKL